MAKILLADDDLDLCATVKAELAAERHIVEVAHDGAQAVAMLKTEVYDVILLDWDMPHTSGIEVLREFRQAGGDTPVIMLTGKAHIAEKEQGFETGADDYLTKPFDARELSVRIRAQLRRRAPGVSNELKHGDVVMDPAKYRLIKAGREVHLAPRDFALLEFFMRNPGHVFPVQTILSRVWSYDSEASPEGLRAAIRRIRKTIDDSDDPQQSIIENVSRVGYRLRPLE